MVLAILFVMQIGVSVASARDGRVLLDPRDGMYLTRIINLTGEQLSIAVTNDTSNSDFVTPYPAYYSGGYSSTSNNPFNNQQNIFTPTPIKLDTLMQHSTKKTYALPKGNAFWEGMINLAPLIPASNENNTYITYSGHFNQGQRLTISTVNNPKSVLNNAYVQFGYVNSSSPKTILWNQVFDFATSTIKNAASLINSAHDGDAAGVISSEASLLSSAVKTLQVSPLNPSLTSAAALSQEPVSSQTNEFNKQTKKYYAQALAFFAHSGDGSCITDETKNNQIYTLASTRQTVVKLTASDNSVRYFTAPAYYIYIKNVLAQTPGDVNECTIAIVDGWVYNLAVGMYQESANLAWLQKTNPLQLMYYAGATTPPVSPVPVKPEPSVPINLNTLAPVTISNVSISYIGG